MLTFEQYHEYYYKYNKLYDQISISNKKFSLIKIKKRYDKYIKKEQKKKQKQLLKKGKGTFNDEKWVNLRKQAFSISPHAEHFFSCLTNTEKLYIKSKMIGEFGILDPMHILGKNKKELYYCLDNILIAPRYFHSLIDNYRNPFTKKYITKEERHMILKRFVSNSIWRKLIKLKRGEKSE